MGRFDGICMVSAESFAADQRVPALRFLADFPVSRSPLDSLLTDQASVQIERLVTASATERLFLIAGRRRQLHTALRVAAKLPHGRLSKFNHGNPPIKNPPKRRA